MAIALIIVGALLLIIGILVLLTPKAAEKINVQPARRVITGILFIIAAILMFYASSSM